MLSNLPSPIGHSQTDLSGRLSFRIVGPETLNPEGPALDPSGRNNPVKKQPGVVAHTCNPSYSGGTVRRIKVQGYPWLALPEK
jgi:hypothetical protein